MNDPDLWEPDAYDAVVLEWSEEAYLLECGTLHSEERMSQDDHGDVLALVVADIEDWVCESGAETTAKITGTDLGDEGALSRTTTTSEGPRGAEANMDREQEFYVDMPPASQFAFRARIGKVTGADKPAVRKWPTVPKEPEVRKERDG